MDNYIMKKLRELEEKQRLLEIMVHECRLEQRIKKIEDLLTEDFYIDVFKDENKGE